jgi:hypothetical protein
MSKTGLYLVIFAILGINGCATSPHIPIGLPNCARPLAVDDEIWNDMLLLREVFSYNSLVDQECIEKLRNRISLHDENS